MRILVLVAVAGCRLGFDVVSNPVSASLVTGVTSADITVCAGELSTATWVLLRVPRALGADDVRALAAVPTADVIASGELSIAAHGCATATARVLDPVAQPANPSEEQRPVYLYAVADPVASSALGLATADARMHPTYELAAFRNPDGHDEQYWIHYPESYYRDPTIAQPTLVFLHGWGEVTHGDYGVVPVEAMLSTSGFLELYEQRAPSVIDQPFVVIAPQCDRALYACWGWVNEVGLVEYALDHAELELRAPLDRGRLYATGISTGGEGAWRVAMDLASVPGHEGHHRVAAAVPVASTFDPDAPTPSYFADHICAATDVAIWAFHATGDDLQRPLNEEAMVASYNQCSSTRKAMLSEGNWTWNNQGHAGWVEVYGNTHGFLNDGQRSVYTWLLAHMRP